MRSRTELEATVPDVDPATVPGGVLAAGGVRVAERRATLARSGGPEVNYRVTIGGQKLELKADVARHIWDEWPEQQRTGKREAAFILWGLDRLGCRCSPVICKPITARTH